MYTINLKQIFIVSLFIAIPFMLSAQLTYGTTGLLHVPSAEMQKDKTVMLGANFMNKEITPPTWYYHTYNYYLNVTILPWMEVAYTCTLFKAEGSWIKALWLLRVHQSGPVFFSQITGIERGTVLEIHARCGNRNLRSFYLVR